jgi:hypothetical protein
MEAWYIDSVMGANLRARAALRANRTPSSTLRASGDKGHHQRRLCTLSRCLFEKSALILPQSSLMCALP